MIGGEAQTMVVLVVPQHPDGKIPKVIQIVQGYNTIMWLMNSGECYHAGYGGPWAKWR